MRILIAEDDAALALFLKKGMEMEGHTVDVAADGATALECLAAMEHELLVLDLGLPVVDGMDVLREAHKASPSVSVLVLTGRNELKHRIECFDSGADDYLQKPFSFHELLARCRAMARRRSGQSSGVVQVGALQMNRLARTVHCGATAVDFTAKEFCLLEYLLLQRGRPISRKELLTEVWKMSADAGTNVVDVYINYLRRKLSAAGSLDVIETVRGEGYLVRMPGKPPASERGLPITAGNGAIAFTPGFGLSTTGAA